MANTVDDLRNEIRVAVGRFEREIAAAFTKEDLAAICEAVDCGIDLDPLPPKGELRAGILSSVGVDADEPVDRSFRKAELEAIADELDGANP
ncbi:hypothetical protein GRX03_01255 [Halovenus sp. WSH3]|uniref:Uncharacterized protein n=1 Tax=Halovenus carboxidivorans TaxID=2692199 RepID=A0A6B0SX13_9EURY|nr:hypothetical protein [Halovenus carboxidivorans]MXR50238.1 hypothetical protein [Halovenus carboxidivorans]